MSELWDATFRDRMLRHALSNDEIVQAVEVAERADDERVALRIALETLLRFAREVDIQACHVQGGVDVRAALAAGHDVPPAGKDKP